MPVTTQEGAGLLDRIRGRSKVAPAPVPERVSERLERSVSSRSKKSRSSTKSLSVHSNTPIHLNSASKSKSTSEQKQAQDVLRLVADVHATTQNKQLRKKTGDALNSVVLATKGHRNYETNVKQNIFRKDKRMSEAKLILDAKTFPEFPVKLGPEYVTTYKIHPTENYVVAVTRNLQGRSITLQLLTYTNDSYNVFHSWQLDIVSMLYDSIEDYPPPLKTIQLQFSPNGKWLLVHCTEERFDSKFFMIDLSSPSFNMYTHDIGLKYIKGVTFSTDSNSLLLIYDDLYKSNSILIPSTAWKTYIEPLQYKTLFSTQKLNYKVNSYHHFIADNHTYYIFQSDTNIHIYKFEKSRNILADIYVIHLGIGIFDIVVHPTLPYLVINTWHHGVIILDMFKMPPISSSISNGYVYGRDTTIELNVPSTYQDCLVYQKKYKKYNSPTEQANSESTNSESAVLRSISLSNKQPRTHNDNHGNSRRMSLSDDGKYLLVCTHDKSMDIFKFGSDGSCSHIYQKRGNIYDAIFNHHSEYIYSIQNVRPKNENVAKAGLVAWKINENSSATKPISLERIQRFDNFAKLPYIPLTSKLQAHPRGRFLVCENWAIPMEYDVYRYEGGRKRANKVSYIKK